MFRRASIASVGSCAGLDLLTATRNYVSPPKRLGKEIRATERYTPSAEPPLLRVRYSRPRRSTKHQQAETNLPSETLGVRELVISHSIFNEEELKGMYEKLRDEILAVPPEVTSAANFIKPLHKDPRLQGKDSTPAHIGTAIRRWELYAPHCPTLVSVTDRLAASFSVEAATNRLNWFRSAADHKPFHHDAHAFDMGEGQYFDPKTPSSSGTESAGDDFPALTYNGLYKGKAANCTVVASFGAERWYCVQDATSSSPPDHHRHLGGTVAVHVPHGTVVAMGRDANILWRHGVPPGTPALVGGEKASNPTASATLKRRSEEDHIYEIPGEGRMSIVVTGWVDQGEELGWKR